jgi:hypothetical protein
MGAEQDDRRRAPRFPLRLPVFLKTCNGKRIEANTFSRDVSSTGISFYLDRPIDEGSELEFIVTLPPEENLQTSIRVSYSAKTVRVNLVWDGTHAVGAAFQSHQFIGQA